MSDTITSEEYDIADELIKELYDVYAMRESIDFRMALSAKYGNPEPENLQVPYDFTPGHSFNTAFLRHEYVETQEDKIAEKVMSGDITQFMVCRTNGADAGSPIAGVQKIYEANPNDPSEIYKAMANSDNTRTSGLLKDFRDEKKLTTTTQISELFWRSAMEKVYAKEGREYNPYIMQSPTSHSVDHIKCNFNKDDIRDYQFLLNKPGFHDNFHKNYLIEMNWRMTQTAIEENRLLFPDGRELRSEDRQGLNYGHLKDLSNKAAESAFERTLSQISQHTFIGKAHAVSKKYADQFHKSIEPKIAKNDFVKSFGKEFKAHKKETKDHAIKRIKAEFKAFAKDKFSELKSKGIEVILAQGIARRRGLTSVNESILKEAKAEFAIMQKDPVKFRSYDRIVDHITGGDKKLSKELLHNLDGRSTFQRSIAATKKFGEYLHANAKDRTRIKAADKAPGEVFAANTLLNVPPNAIHKNMANAIKEQHYSVDDTMAVRGRMLKGIKKIKDDSGELTDTKRIIGKVSESAARNLEQQKRESERRDLDDQLKKQESQPTPSNGPTQEPKKEQAKEQKTEKASDKPKEVAEDQDEWIEEDDGPTPDGSTPKKKRRRKR